MRLLRLAPWARTAFSVGLGLSLIFLVPLAAFPVQLGKMAFFSVFLIIAVVLSVLSGGAQLWAESKRTWLSFLPLLLPAVAFASWRYSMDRSIGLSGFSIESDTVLFLFLCALTFILASILFRSSAAVRQLFLWLCGSIGVAALFQLLLVGAGRFIPLAFFSDHSVNMIGKWNDFGLVTAMVLLLCVYWTTEVRTMRSRVALSACALALFLLAVLVQFPLVWSLLLAFSVLILIWSFASRRRQVSCAREAIAWGPLLLAVLSLLFLLWGAAFNTRLFNVFPISSLEVRPSFASTLDLVRESHGQSLERFLLGTGPNTFGEEWLLHKPAAVNQSPFWNLDFNVGFSTLASALVSVGALGMLLWFVPLLLVLLGVAYAARVASGLANQERVMLVSIFLASVYAWCGVVFYVPSEDVLLLMFALCGAAFGFMEALSAQRRAVAAVHVRSRFSVLIAVLLILSIGVVSGSVVRRCAAQWYVGQGAAAVGQGDSDSALTLSARARSIEVTGDVLRLEVDAGTAKLQAIATASSSPASALQKQFSDVLQQTFSTSKDAIAWDPQDYRTYVSVGRLYDFLASLTVQGAYANAQQAYLIAARYNPTNPQIPLLLARLEAGQGSVSGVQAYLSQALTLKPDYTDAILMAVQLYVANKDLPNAIRAAQAAVQSAPGVPSVGFELGLLYYSGGDTAHAIPVLEQVLKLQPDYANAKYFLGLSYAAQGRDSDAVGQFQDLQKSNPDNQEVSFILANLLAGKAPFAGAEPPITPTPQNRAQAPISQ